MGSDIILIYSLIFEASFSEIKSNRVALDF